jgi:UDP:flavonoid glycosyltransferase YjiC (YdhE family)
LTSDIVLPTLPSRRGNVRTNNNGLVETSVGHEVQEFDVVLLADVTRGGDIGLRIRREIQTLAGAGYRCALRHLPLRSGKAISPDIQRCVREGLVQPVGPEDSVHARLAIVYSPGAVDASVDLGGLAVGRVVLVVDTLPSARQMGFWWNFALAPMLWAPANRWVRGGLLQLGFPVPLAQEDWRAIASPVRSRPDTAPTRTKPVLGRVSTSASSQWPATAQELDAVYADAEAVAVWTHGALPADLAKDSVTAPSWTVIRPGGMSVERFVEAIDAIVYFPGAHAPELPEAAIMAAMASGKPVILPHRFRPHFGPAAVYADPPDALGEAARLLADGAALQTLRDAAAARCRLTNSGAAYLDGIDALIGPPEHGAKPAAPALENTARQRILFVPSGGVGLGHATRLLAIARRLDDTLEPVFASLGQAGDVFDAMGYRAEYIPAQSDTGAGFAEWDAWLRHELAAIIDRHDPAVVVFDGNNPTPGLVQAALSHGACRLVWVRRGMCPPTPSPHLGNARFFDCVIEPGEYAAERDRGPTSRLRHEVVQVPPIRLLDGAELLSRDTARSELGLDPDRPAVLVQPGSGANRDVVDLTDRLVSQLRRFDGLQIVIAEWSNGAMSLPRWPGTRRLKGFPLSRVYAAFDFSVSAAGYNTFHEVIAQGLPTIFVANRHPSMDDQGARAEFAQDHGAGFDLKEEEMHLFPTLCRAMLTPQANAVLREGCAAFDPANGAADAAAIIRALAGGAA